MADGKYCTPNIETYPWLDKHLGSLNAVWKPISLTYVLYPDGDIIGKALAWSSHIPIFIIVSFITLILFRRELHTMAFFCGLLINVVLNHVIKESIQSPRPCRSSKEDHLYNKYGMPSTHAQFMGFFAIYMFFFAYVRLKMHVSEQFMDNIRQHLIASSSIGSTLVVTYSRVYLHYHSVEQVVVGLIIGIIFGAVWFYVVDSFCTPLFQEIANTKVAEYFLIRDSSNIPDILWFEYTASRTEARQRQRRVAPKSQ